MRFHSLSALAIWLLKYLASPLGCVVQDVGHFRVPLLAENVGRLRDKRRPVARRHVTVSRANLLLLRVGIPHLAHRDVTCRGEARMLFYRRFFFLTFNLEPWFGGVLTQTRKIYVHLYLRI